MLKIWFLLALSSIAQADLDKEACKVVSFPSPDTPPTSTQDIIDTLNKYLSSDHKIAGKPPGENSLYYEEWSGDSNKENEKKCTQHAAANYCTPSLAGVTLYRYFNKNVGGVFGSGLFSKNWILKETTICKSSGDDTGTEDVAPPGLVPVVAFNQAMNIADNSLDSAGTHVSDKPQFDPNGLIQEAAVDGGAAKDNGAVKKSASPTPAPAAQTGKNIAEGSGSVGPTSSVPGLTSASTDPAPSTISTDPLLDVGSGKYAANGAGASHQNGAGDLNGWGSSTGNGVAGGADELNFRGLASDVNPMGSEDPANYFALIGIDENIFKKVEKRYRETATHWARVDLTRDSASRKERALAAAKDPELAKPKKEIH